MFPTLWSEFQSLSPEIYFGGSEVPPYLHMDLPDGDSIMALSTAIIEATGQVNASGYIDSEGIHYHIPDSEDIQVDLSREFVFVSEPSAEGSPTSWQVLRFLQEPVKKLLLIGPTGATPLEKTPETYQLCIALDKVWADQNLPEFLMNVPLEAGEDIPFSLALPRLMRLYEELNFADSSMMWEFWEIFASYLMEHRLHLRVSRIEKRFGWPCWQLN